MITIRNYNKTLRILNMYREFYEILICYEYGECNIHVFSQDAFIPVELFSVTGLKNDLSAMNLAIKKLKRIRPLNLKRRKPWIARICW